MTPSRLALTILSLCLPVTLAAQGSDARNRSMGGTGVASSHYSGAGFINPALLARASSDADIAIVLPYVGGFAADEDELIDRLEDFQDTLDRFQGFVDAMDFASANALRPTLAAQLQDLDNRRLDVELDAALSISIPSETFAIAVVARSYVDGQSFLEIDPADIALINDPGETDLDQDLVSQARFIAAGILEVGVAVAHEFQILGLPVAVGVTPKFQQIETFNYSVNAQNFDDDDAFDDFDDDVFRDDDTTFNVDAGLALTPFPGFTFGLAASNMLSEKVDTVVTSGSAFTYQVEPSLTAGLAFSGLGFTVAADIDVTETERFDLDDATRYMRLGVEYDLAGWLQLRAGYFNDTGDTDAELYTGGVGIAPFDIVRLDLVGLIGDNSAGAAAQFSITL